MGNFLILLWLLNRFVFKPLGQFLENRKSQIENDLKSAENNRKEAEAFVDEQKLALEAARTEAKEIRANAEVTTKKERELVLENARQESQELLEKAQKEIDLSVSKAKQDLLTEVGQLSINLSKQILKRQLKEDDQKAIMDDYLAKING